MKNNKAHKKNLEKENLLLGIHLKKLYEKKAELNDILKNLANQKISTIPIQSQVKNNKKEINSSLEKKNKIQGELILLKKQELKRKPHKPKKPEIKNSIEQKDNKKNDANIPINPDSIKNIPWNKIIFSKGFITINYKKFHKEFLFENSRDAFQAINSSYKNENLKFPEIIFKNNNIFKIANPQIVNTFLEILQLQSYYEIDIQDYKLLYEKIINTNKFSYHKDHFSIYKKADYLNHLFSIHNKTQKLLYIPEYIVKNGKIIDKHESYLFLTQKHFDYYLIWESANFGKATYIFKTSKLNIEKDRIKLFVYLASRKKENKRDNIIHSNSLKDEYQFLFRILHYKKDYKRWKTQLEKYMNN